MITGGVVSAGFGGGNDDRVGSSGNASAPSPTPSPSVSVTNGSVPAMSSAKFDRPSPSESGFAAAAESSSMPSGIPLPFVSAR